MIDLPREGEHVKFAIEILREARDVLRLLQQGSVGCHLSTLLSQSEDRAQRKIGVAINALKRRKFVSAIDNPACDARAKPMLDELGLVRERWKMRIFDQRFNIMRAFGTGLVMMKTLADRPAVITAFHNQIHFFPSVLPHVSGIEFASLPIEAHPPNVAQAVYIDFLFDAVTFFNEGII